MSSRLASDWTAGPRRTLTAREGKKGAMTKLMRFSRTGAWLTAFTIIVLSVVPGKMRPHVLGNDYFEHFLAYFATGSLLAIGYQRPMQLLSSGVLLATCAGLLECIQLWIPGRTASVGGFTTAAAGAWTGLLVAIVVRRVYERRFVVSYK
jgi:VanZ family protein